MPISKIKEETRFITTDGMAHAHSSTAQQHQNRLDFFEWCSANICRGGEWSWDMVANEIWKHWDLHMLAKPRKDGE